MLSVSRIRLVGRNDMRCSECFGEMEQKPQGLVCKSCGFSVQIVDEDGAVVPEVETVSRDRGWLKWVIAAAVLLAALAGAGYWYSGLLEVSERGQIAVIANEPTRTPIVQTDAQNLIAYADLIEASPGQVRVLGEASCLRLSGDAGARVDQISWLDLSGNVVASLAPQLPANWSLAGACRSTSGRVQTLAGSADGLSLSGVDQEGTILWTRILSGDRRDAALHIMPGQTDQTIVLMRTGAQEFDLRVFDSAGQELWRRGISGTAPGPAPELTTNRVGDLVMAWNEQVTGGGLSLSVLALSAQNIVNFSQTYFERTVGLSGLAGDDLASTYILEGEAGFAVQKIRADGTPDWRRWLDASARPIGIVFDGSDLVVAAYQDGDLLFWRLNEAGQRSVAIPVPLGATVAKAYLESLDDTRARVTLWFDDGAQRGILVNLVRLREAAVIETGDFLPPSEPEAPGDAMVDTVDLAVPAEGPDQTTPSEEIAPVAMDPEPTIASEPPISSPVADTEGAIEAAPVQRDPSPEPEPETVEAPDQVASDPPVEVAPIEPARDAVSVAPEAICTFFCAALDNSEVTYPMTEAIVLGEDEALESLEARLEGIHERICADSGGQLVVESLPNCTAQ